MNDRPARKHRSKVQIDLDDAANLVRAKANPDKWLQYEPELKIGTRAKEHLRSWGLEVKESDSYTWVRWSSGELFPVEVAPVPVMAPAAEWDTVAPRRTDCPYCQYAGQMIRIKDELIAEMGARIIYLEARRDG